MHFLLGMLVVAAAMQAGIAAPSAAKRNAPVICEDHPCLNGASCYSRAHPTWSGRMYKCLCVGNFGGFNCEILDPCDDCPHSPKLQYCIRTANRTTGRICLGRDLKPLEKENDRRIFHKIGNALRLGNFLKGTKHIPLSKSDLAWLAKWLGPLGLPAKTKKRFFNKIGNAFKGAGNAIKTGVSKTGDAFKTADNGIKNGMETGADKIGKFAYGAWTKSLHLSRSNLSWLARFLGRRELSAETKKRIFKKIGKAFKKAASKTGDAFKTAGNAVKNGVETGIDKTGDVIDAAGNVLKTPFKRNGPLVELAEADIEKRPGETAAEYEARLGEVLKAAAGLAGEDLSVESDESGIDDSSSEEQQPKVNRNIPDVEVPVIMLTEADVKREPGESEEEYAARMMEMMEAAEDLAQKGVMVGLETSSSSSSESRED